MAQYNITLGDQVYRVTGPDEMTEQQALQAAQEQAGSAPPAYPDALELHNRFSDRVTPKSERIAMGMTDPIAGGAQLLYNAAPQSVKDVAGQADQWLYDQTGGLLGNQEPDVNKRVQQREAAYNPPEGFDWMRAGGNALTSLPLASQGLISSLLGGAANSALMPVTEGDFTHEKWKQMGTGAAIGTLLHGAGGLLNGVISPKASTDPGLRELLDAGVTPSVGQAFGDSWINAIEQKAQSLPFVGDALRDLRQRGLESFNRATINKALTPIGQIVEADGHTGAGIAAQRISDAYDEALQGVDQIVVDGPAQAAYQGWLTKLSKFPAEIQQEVQRVITQPLNLYGLHGSTYKHLDSELGGQAQRFGKNQLPSIQDAGKLIGEYQKIVREMLQRQYPDQAPMVRSADKAYEAMQRVYDATISGANNEGIFTPVQLMQAVRRNDPSLAKANVAQGDALLQDWAGLGTQYIRNTVPDSGTPTRLLAATLDPTTALSMAAVGQAHGAPTNDLLLSLVAKRPRAASTFRDIMERVLPFTDYAASGLSRSLNQ